ncbi:C39 family peptidase [Guyparkeria sp. 1SP6A2]|nr:C39 family peptidase [Guyparkeria sp. 1SP6A2]
MRIDRKTRQLRNTVMSMGWIAAITLGLPAAGQAANIQFAGILPHGQVMEKPVVSMLEHRYKNVVRQQFDFSCGAAALATLLRYAYGLRLDEATVLAGMWGISDPELVRTRGFSLLEMKEYLAQLGYRGRGYQIDLRRLKTINVPTIVLMDVNGYQHFVVLKHARDGYVHVADPALGNRRYPLEEFLETWPSRTVFAVIGPGFDRQTVLLESTDIPSSYALHRRSGQVPTAELFEFGFTHADMF